MARMSQCPWKQIGNRHECWDKSAIVSIALIMDIYDVRRHNVVVHSALV